MTGRDAFFERVRQAVTEGNRTGSAATLPDRDGVGIGCLEGGDLVQRFCGELTTAGGKSHIVDRPEQVVDRVMEIIDSCKAQRVLIGGGVRKGGPHGPSLTLPARMTCDAFFEADLGITTATHLIAETGTVVLASGPEEPRSVSLLPPVHIVLAHRSQILPDMFDLFALFPPGEGKLPSCLTLITGPSKTGDIELRLVTGVHGPGEVHVILGTW